MLVLSGFLVAGCGAFGIGEGTMTVGMAPYEQGSGTVASASRTADPFHAISAAQGVRVQLASGPDAITVTTDDNLLSHVTTVVTDGVLVVDVTGSFQTHHAPTVVVTTATPPDGLTASTGATIDARDLGGASLAIGSSTGATVRGTGQVDALNVSAATGASADLRDVRARSAEVNVTTGSTAHVNASDVVTGTCSTGSTVRVRGGAATSGLAVDQSSSVTHE
jgi:putative autotransporter adhesin-like protein